MKKHAVSILILLICSTVAMADDWSRTFLDTFFAKGVDEAVVNALGEGVPPDQIIKAALPLKDLKKEDLIKALYCALVPPADIQDGATVNGITDEIVQKGYELALAQCADEMEEKTKASPTFLPGKASPSGGRPVTASPWKFE